MCASGNRAGIVGVGHKPDEHCLVGRRRRDGRVRRCRVRPRAFRRAARVVRPRGGAEPPNHGLNPGLGPKCWPWCTSPGQVVGRGQRSDRPAPAAGNLVAQPHRRSSRGATGWSVSPRWAPARTPGPSSGRGPPARSWCGPRTSRARPARRWGGRPGRGPRPGRRGPPLGIGAATARCARRSRSRTRCRPRGRHRHRAGRRRGRHGG
jgi:hypothetical protein